MCFVNHNLRGRAGGRLFRIRPPYVKIVLGNTFAYGSRSYLCRETLARIPSLA